MIIHQATMIRHKRQYTYYRNSVNGRFASYKEFNDNLNNIYNYQSVNNYIDNLEILYHFCRLATPIIIDAIYFIRDILKSNKENKIKKELENKINNKESKLDIINNLKYYTNEVKKCA